MSDSITTPPSSYDGASTIRPLSVRMTDDTRAQLDIIAQLNNRSVTEEVRFALEHWIEKSKSDPKVLERAEVVRKEIERALDIEMQAWRPFIGSGGQPIQLKPDLGLVTATSEHEDHWFIEVDQGTESLRTLLDKCALYETHRRTGREQAASGVYPRVLWIMPTSKRVDQLRALIVGARSLDPRLFAVISPEGLAAAIGEPETLTQNHQRSTQTRAAKAREGGSL